MHSCIPIDMIIVAPTRRLVQIAPIERCTQPWSWCRRFHTAWILPETPRWLRCSRRARCRRHMRNPLYQVLVLKWNISLIQWFPSAHHVVLPFPSPRDICKAGCVAVKLAGFLNICLFRFKHVCWTAFSDHAHWHRKNEVNSESSRKFV